MPEMQIGKKAALPTHLVEFPDESGVPGRGEVGCLLAASMVSGTVGSVRRLAGPGITDADMADAVERAWSGQDR